MSDRHHSHALTRWACGQFRGEEAVLRTNAGHHSWLEPGQREPQDSRDSEDRPVPVRSRVILTCHPGTELNLRVGDLVSEKTRVVDLQHGHTSDAGWPELWTALGSLPQLEAIRLVNVRQGRKLGGEKRNQVYGPFQRAQKRLQAPISYIALDGGEQSWVYWDAERVALPSLVALSITGIALTRVHIRRIVDQCPDLRFLRVKHTTAHNSADIQEQVAAVNVQRLRDRKPVLEVAFTAQEEHGYWQSQLDAWRDWEEHHQ